MYFTKKKAILKILNPNVSKEELIIPSYNHIMIDNDIYIPTNSFKIPDTIQIEKKTSCYLIFHVTISGLISKAKGYLPNPMYESATIRIDHIEYHLL